MENVLPKYQRPITLIKDPMSKVEYWDIATESFDEKKYKESVIAVINYINTDLLKNKNTSDTINIVYMQGSAEIQVQITNDLFSVKAPFLKIADTTNEVALFRKVAEVNFSPLTLAQIRLQNKELWFEYEMPLSLCNPYKVYDVLREICVYADDYDDMFISKYKATFYKAPKKTNLTAIEQQQVWEQISFIIEDYKNYSSYFLEKRWNAFMWDIIIISLLKISNMPYVNGTLRTDLSEYINNMSNSNIDFNLRVDKGTNFMKKFCDKSQEEIMSNVYYADQFISLRWRSSASIITNQMERYLNQVEEYNNNERYFDLCYYLQFIFLKLIYDFNLEQNYKTAIYNSLEKVSGKEPHIASPILTDLYYAMYNGNIDKVNSKKSKGFFSKLFS